MNLHDSLASWQHTAENLFPEALSKGSLEHALEEVREVIDETDREKRIVEYADIFMCLATALNSDGITLDELSWAVSIKHEINRKRTWKKVIGEHGIYYKHVKQ